MNLKNLRSVLHDIVLQRLCFTAFLSLFPKNFNFFRFSLIKRNHSLTLKQTHTVTPILYFQAKMALNCQICRKSSFSAELGSTKWSSRGVWKWCRKSENFKIFFWKLFLYGRKILSQKNEFKKSLQSSSVKWKKKLLKK